MDDDLLVNALRDPGCTSSLSGADWNRLYQQARSTGLLGRLAHLLGQGSGAAPDPKSRPPGLQGHLEAATRLCEAQSREVHREARYLDHALANLGAPVVMLKGAAYALAQLPVARGRVFSDIDILVPKSHLSRAESLLMMNGWMSSEPSAYNQHYYRQWMHELPPMQHVHRSTVLDVHHAILPQTSRLRPDSALLLATATPLPGTQVLHVLAPVDMVLHSMTHLFANDDMSHAMRDLSDLDLLLRHFGQRPGWWDELAPRAAVLDLSRLLFYALAQLRRVWRTPVPTALLEGLKNDGPVAATMGLLWDQAFTIAPTSGDRAARRLALAALYLRGHWLRMPMPLLARHLSIKALGLHKERRRNAASPFTPTG